METKVYRAPVAMKGGDAGTFRAVFSRFNVRDHDGDVTRPGAFTTGQTVPIEAWNHNYSALPVGKAVIASDQERAWVAGRFFLDTESGREHYEALKALGELAEWSYTFQILQSEPGTVDGQPVRILKRLDVWGVGPVQRGAGIGTRTEAIKSSRSTRRRRSTGLDRKLADVELRIELARVETRIKQAAGSPTDQDPAGRPTNRDVLRQRILDLYGPDHSRAWLEVMLEAELAGLVDRVARDNHRGGVARGLIEQEALEYVTWWAGQPVPAG